MCGINGVVDFKYPVEHDIVRQMNRVISHRGPDGEGVYQNDDATCCFGHVRLSIIDVEGSKQPLCNESKSIWITFNGEIYNYKELRKQLLSRGHKFETAGDTETLVHLYEEYGVEMLHQLYGMFAFAIWDSENKKLFFARDRLGIKPFFYREINSGLIFSSEQKGILHYPHLEIDYNEEAIWQYLTFRSTPAPLTLFKGINKLLPGHYGVYDENGIMIQKYWEIPYSNPVVSSNNIDKLIVQTEAVLIKSIERRLISDVPLGAFLSGGVDSSLIVALMTKLTGKSVKTYSVGFDNFEASEISYAKIVADLCKTEHHELILQEDVFTDHLEALTYLRDAPLSEPADIPLFLLSKMANKDVKVLLSGEGSDEIFAGYPKYAVDRFSKCVSIWPDKVAQRILRLMPAKYRKIELALKSLHEEKKENRWPLWFSPFSVDEKKKIFNGNYTNYENPIKRIIDENILDNSLRSFLFCDCKFWLPDNLLDRGDRMTMGASIEARVPFLDHDLVEHAFRLPDRVKIRGCKRKWIIKAIAEKYLPDEIVNRPKAGFVMPMANWFRGKLREYCYDLLCSEDYLPSNLISKGNVCSILDDHCSGKKDYYLQIWTLLGLALWHNSCLKKYKI